ncbi:hypothetical protein CASFOL_035454 [Castilleja foliolosa]|uniref:BHLH domain-containing protein n=1 Tax=Castilleja foliolosa TaxID=1961234 RepID=A0ABD3BTE9_9LAMI
MNPDYFQVEDVYSIPTNSRSKKPATGEEGVTELRWENGHVVMQNQRPLKKTDSGGGEGEVVIAAEREARLGGEEHLFMQEDEMGSWLQYPLDDLYADLLYPPTTPPLAAVSTVTQSRVVAPEPARRPPVAPIYARPDNAPRIQNFGHFSRIPGTPRTEPMNQLPVPESTVVESNLTPMVRQLETRVSLANVESGTATTAGTWMTTGDLTRGICEQTLTSSSPGLSPASFSASGEAHQPQKRPEAPPEDRKRKARENDDNEYHSEDAEFEAAEAKKTGDGSTSAKRSRAAEVHNLSERRRRDRINEKMRSLQELIPRCNKSDKASMLDEAIEYVKSLQMQIQMMSMGYPMVPMMYPGMQQYMPAMGLSMGMNRPMVPYHPSMLPTSNPAQMTPRFPMPSPFPMPQAQTPDPRIQTPNANQTDHAVNFSQYQNQPGMPNYVDPYQQFAGMFQGQYPIPQNQAVLHPGSNKPSTSKDIGNLDSQIGN